MPKQTCKCEWCAKWSPIVHRIDNKLDGKLKKDFGRLITHFMSEGEDGDVAQAKLDGSWPGWEWLPKEVARRAGMRVDISTRNGL